LENWLKCSINYAACERVEDAAMKRGR